MRTRNPTAPRNLSWLIIASLIMPAILSLGCEKSVEDVRAWSKDRRYERKMKEFILSDNTEEVKVESIVVLIERNKAVNLDPILSELPTAERDTLLAKVLPRIEDMSQSDNQGSRLLAKDGAYWILKLEPKVGEELSARLKAIMLKWIDDPNAFWRPAEKVGTVERKQIFEELGASGLPVIERQMKARLAQLKEAKDKQLEKLGLDINEVLQLARSLNLPETDERMAAIMVEQMELLYPNIPIVLAKAFEQNKSEKLLPMARKIAVDNTYTAADLIIIKDFIIKEFYRQVQPKEGIKVCRQVVQRSTEGYYRWDCARTLVINAKEKGVEYFFEDLPDEHDKLAIPADHLLVAEFQLNPTTFHWDEIGSFCNWVQVDERSPLKGQFPLDAARKGLKSEVLGERIASMLCLTKVGEAKDAAYLKSVSEDKDAAKISLEGWGFGDEEEPVASLADLAGVLVKELESGDEAELPE